jgi:hypothetical protein
VINWFNVVVLSSSFLVAAGDVRVVTHEYEGLLRLVDNDDDDDESRPPSDASLPPSCDVSRIARHARRAVGESLADLSSSSSSQSRCSQSESEDGSVDMQLRMLLWVVEETEVPPLVGSREIDEGSSTEPATGRVRGGGGAATSCGTIAAPSLPAATEPDCCSLCDPTTTGGVPATE